MTYCFTAASFEALDLEPSAFKISEDSMTNILIVLDERGVHGPRGSPIIVITIYSPCSDDATLVSDAQTTICANLLGMASFLMGTAKFIRMSKGALDFAREDTVIIKKLTETQKDALQVFQKRLSATSSARTYDGRRINPVISQKMKGNRSAAGRTIANGLRAPNGQGKRYEKEAERARERGRVQRAAKRAAAAAGSSAASSSAVSNALAEETPTAPPRKKLAFKIPKRPSHVA